MHTLNVLLYYTLVILIMSYGIGLIWGGPKKANWIIKWELKQLFKFLRWILGHLLQAITNLLQKLTNTCKPPKKKKKHP